MQNTFLKFIWEASVGGGLIILLILLIRAVFRYKLPRRFIYASWLLVAVRLLIPMTVTSPVSVFSIVRPPIAQSVVTPVSDVQHVSEPMERPSIVNNASPQRDSTTDIAPSIAITSTVAPTIGWETIVMITWGVGAVLTLAYIVIVNMRFKRNIRANTVAELGMPQSMIYQQLCTQLRCRKLPVVVARNIPTPCLCGTFRPYIALTVESMRFDPFRYVALHELCHYKQRDHIWGLVRNLCCVLFWFHPLVWIAANVSKADCELSCDARVLRLEKDGRFEYAETLIKLIDTKVHRNRTAAVQTSTAMAAGKKAMKERIKMIVSTRKKAWMATAVAVILLAAAGCGVMSAGAAKESDAVKTDEPVVIQTDTPAPTVTETATPTPAPVSVDLSGESITNERLKEMIENGEISKDTIEELKLSLGFVDSNKDIPPLDTFTNLKKLRLDGDLTIDLTPFVSLVNLEELTIICSKAVNLKPLAPLKNLKKLSLHHNYIDDVTSISSLVNLEELDISVKGFNYLDSFASLSKLKHLKKLSLSGSLNADDITPLKSLTNLKELDFLSGGWSSEKVDELRKALPDCVINVEILTNGEDTDEQELPPPGKK